MSLVSRIAKKLRRRKRDKGLRKREVSVTMTEAERLIMSNWGLSFKNHEPERAGEKRAKKRLDAKLKANEDIPSPKGITRQVARAQLRRMEKMARQQETVKHTRRGSYA